ncbi:MAG TPA: DUF58 domain-containing protein [Candidatus Thermoplasmatota archaeon]|nr:DUF58 domain-containing protein [Candidatus Thermoplasmatota archaeon]
MEPTGLARVLLAGGGGLLVVGVLTASLAPSAAGLAVILLLAHARFAADAAFAATTLRYKRRVLEPVLHEGEAFHVEIDGRDSALPPGVRVSARDLRPAETPALDDPTVEGADTATYTLLATAKGTHTFTHVVADLLDARGLWRARRLVPLETTVHALASLEAIEAGRRLAKRDPLDASAKSPVGLLVRDLEFESLRAFAPGDRLRDVDWKRYAKVGALLTKTWEKELEATVLVLLDAGRTMRAADDRASKLDHAATLALELVEAAIDRNHRVAFAAFDELDVVDDVPATRDRSLPRRLAERLADLPARLLAARRLDVGLPDDAPADAGEVAFLAAVQGLAARAPARPRPGVAVATERAIAGLGDQKLFVVLFTDLETLPDATLKSVATLAERGHRVVAVVLPGTSYRAPPAEPRLRDLENAYRERATRRRARTALARRGVRIVEIDPGTTAAAIAAAARKDPNARGGVR